MSGRGVNQNYWTRHALRQVRRDRTREWMRAGARRIDRRHLKYATAVASSVVNSALGSYWYGGKRVGRGPAPDTRPRKKARARSTSISRPGPIMARTSRRSRRTTRTSYKTRSRSKKGRRRVRRKSQRKIDKRQNKRLRSLEIANPVGTHTRKHYDTMAMVVDPNTAEYHTRICWNPTKIEETLSKLRFFDPSTAGLEVIPGAQQTWHRKYNIDSLYCSLKLFGSVVARSIVHVYVLEPRKATDVVPQVNISDGLQDQMGTTDYNLLNVDHTGVGASPYDGNISEFPLQVAPSDSKQFTATWKILKVHKFMLQPGESRTITTASKGFMYSPNQNDDDIAFFPKHQSRVFMIRVCGHLVHEGTDNFKIGRNATQVGLEFKRVVRVKYEAGQRLRDIVYDRNEDTITATGADEILPQKMETNQGGT